MNMKIPEVVKPLSIYYGYSTWKMFWEGKFTLRSFTLVHMKNCGCHNVRKHRKIKNGERYIKLDISLKFVSLDNMKFTSSDPKYYLEISGKGFISSLGLKTIVRSKKKKGEV